MRVYCQINDIRIAYTTSKDAQFKKYFESKGDEYKKYQFLK